VLGETTGWSLRVRQRTASRPSRDGSWLEVRACRNPNRDDEAVRLTATPNAELLEDELAAVDRDWVLARQRWRDAVAERFQREYLDPQAPVMRALVQSMRDLEEELARALRSVR